MSFQLNRQNIELLTSVAEHRVLAVHHLVVLH